MKIECVRTYHVRHRLDEPFAFSQWAYDQRNALLVEVIAEGGVAGWGECYGPAEVNQAAVAGYYAPRILGLDALATDVLWHTMWQTSLDFARGGVMMAAISGIDMALWDLKGHALGQSVGQLLGGRYRDRVPCYATGMYFRDLPDDALIEALVVEATGYRDEGFAAMKIKLGKYLPFDMKLIAAMREALPQARLMADANHAYDLPEATRVGRALEHHDYAWFEEPLSPEHEHQYADLQRQLRVPLAAGECEQTRFGFRRLLSAGGVQIAQPDLAYCGGISEAVKIRAVASSLGINTVPHCWGTMLNVAAATHFLASNYREPGRAEADASMLELDRSPNALRDQLFETPVPIERGIARVPDTPGLGVTVDRGELLAFQVTATESR